MAMVGNVYWLHRRACGSSLKPVN